LISRFDSKGSRQAGMTPVGSKVEFTRESTLKMRFIEYLIPPPHHGTPTKKRLFGS